jgi:DNA polymerase III epsilon subunit-like protein
MNKSIPHVVVDIEANGGIIGKNSMISFAAVIVEQGLKRTFYREIKPISDSYTPEALAVTGFTHEQTKKFMDPMIAMQEFDQWLYENIDGRPIFWSDNNGFDAAWINYYFLSFTSKNPFGHSSRRIGDFAAGIELDLKYQWKWLRKKSGFKHTHNALDDAKGNAFALLQLFIRMEELAKKGSGF